MPVSGRGGFNPRSSRPSQGPSSFLVPSWAWLSRPTSFSPLQKIGDPIWDVGNWKGCDWGWGWRWVGRETPLCVTKKSDGAGGLNMERGKVARSSGEGKPEGEIQGENGRPRVQSTRGRSRLLSSSSEKVSALPANESMTLVWTRVPGQAPSMCGQWETRPHMQ